MVTDEERLILLAEHERFETERLILRKVALADATDILEINAAPEVVRYLTYSALTDLAAAKSFIAKVFLAHPLEMWGIVDKATGKLIGSIQLHAKGEVPVLLGA